MNTGVGSNHVDNWHIRNIPEWITNTNNTT